MFEFLFKTKKKSDHKTKIIETLKKQDTKMRNNEINTVKKLNKKLELITGTGSIEIIIKNVNGVIRELK